MSLKNKLILKKIGQKTVKQRKEHASFVCVCKIEKLTETIFCDTGELYN